MCILHKESVDEVIQDTIDECYYFLKNINEKDSYFYNIFYNHPNEHYSLSLDLENDDFENHIKKITNKSFNKLKGIYRKSFKTEEELEEAINYLKDEENVATLKRIIEIVSYDYHINDEYHLYEGMNFNFTEGWEEIINKYR